jgi:excisionase family DNA binding protein
MLHMHPRTVRRLLASGELPGTRLGRQWRISVTAIRKLIEAGGDQKPKAPKGE